MTERPLVTIGRVVKPHGIRGEVAVEVLSDVPGRFDPGAEVVLGGTPTRIETSRPHQTRLLVRFEGVTDRGAAERLRGCELQAESVDLEDTDTYYVHELVGAAVLDQDGTDLGTVSGLIELPAAAEYDLLEVRRPDGRTWLLPAVDDYVEVEDGPDGGLRLRLVDAPEGLIDDAGAEVAAPDDEERGR